ncbi:MFS transporter [Alsobacter sp. SYSU M60028]|uniref:MFS transporter n=1 Tax=Alsobacter ponti TaxID=2962936 RepID=A0ABT1LA32_9HYPH|nr:MFS transporter [Alsobacter ponti]MCP8938341.1 MFS transporter [Alsobacter ponti]
MTASPTLTRATRFAPEAILLCGCLTAIITFGPRASVGLFQIPMSQDFGWSREVFSFAVAIQNLLWGVGQPFAGAVADRFGVVRVLIGGALLYAAGQALMAYSSTPSAMALSAGVLIGFGLSGCSFNLVLGAFGKLLPESWRGMAFGAGTAAGSLGQFLFPPIGSVLIEHLGWQSTSLIFSATILAVVPLSLTLATRGAASATSHGPSQSVGQAFAEALRHRSYVLLVLGFFTCGFQLAFITSHMPAYLSDLGLPAWVGGWTLAVIGLANAVGSLTSGWLCTRMPRRYLLSAIYLGRALAVLVFIMLPPSPANAIGFGVAMGLLWLSTVPPTSSLVALMFGTRYLSMLYGFAFFSHQLGGFLGVWLGGVLYEQTGSYLIVWWLSVALGVASAAINLPIREKAVARPEVAPA